METYREIHQHELNNNWMPKSSSKYHSLVYVKISAKNMALSLLAL